VICRIEAFVQKLQLHAQVLDVCVQVLETIVSGVKEVRSVVLTSSEKPVILYGDAKNKAGFVHEVFGASSRRFRDYLRMDVAFRLQFRFGKELQVVQVQVATWRALCYAPRRRAVIGQHLGFARA
jgi:hypothetical protein